DLEYLRRGCRDSKADALVCSLMCMKAILHVDDGKLVLIEKIRGSKKLFKRMIEIMKERGTDFQNQTIGISHGDDPKRAEQLANMISSQFGIDRENILIETIGAVIGAHSGPGTLAVFFLNQPYR